MEKEVLYANKLLRLNWRRAHLSVSTATVLVIIGYSLPVTDTAARLLFSQLPRNTKVYIVNTDSNEDFKRRSARYFAPTQAQLDWTYAGIDDALERFCIIELPKLREMSFK